MISTFLQELDSMLSANKQPKALFKTNRLELSIIVEIFSLVAKFAPVAALNVTYAHQDSCPTWTGILRNAKPAACGETPAPLVMLTMDVFNARKGIGN